MRKRLVTRRRSAVRWCAAAAALLAAVWVLLPWEPTLAAAHQRAMEDWLASPAETLYQTETPLGNWLVLAQSQDTVCLGCYQRVHWLNWQCDYVLTVDREEGRPFAAGHYGARIPVRDGGGEAAGVQNYVFGCVWDPAVETLEVYLRCEDSEDRPHEQTVSLNVEDLKFDSRGERWFFIPMEPERDIWSWYCSVTAYDSQGSSLGRRLVAGVPRWE